MPARRGLFVRRDTAAGTSPQDARLAQAGLVTASGPLGVVPGVLSGCVVAGTSGWAYTVGAGHYVTSRSAADGAVIGALDGTTTTETVAAAPASGSRYDLIWVRQRDVDSGDSDSLAVVGVTSGTASGTPARPYGSVPVGALVLAEALVAAGATQTAHANVTITQVAPAVSARGGVAVVPNAAVRDALGVAAGGHVLAYRSDERIVERRTAAGGWQSLTGVHTGTVAVPAFSLPQATAPATILGTTTLAHPFSGEVVVEAELVGDAIIGANTSVRFLLTVSGQSRQAWAQNFSAGGNVRDNPSARVITTVAAGTPVTVQVQAADVGSGGTSNGTGVLSVAWTIRPGRGAA